MIRIAVLVGFVLLAPLSAAEPKPVVISELGKANYPVVIAENASKQTQENARRLADYLSRLAGF